MAVEPLPRTLVDDRMPGWWRPFALDLDGAHLVRRRHGVEALRRALSLENVVDAVAYAHGDTESGARIIALVRDATRSADASCAEDVHDAEPPALVAAALADELALEPDTELATLISLLVLCARYSGAVPAIDGMRLPDYAARQLEHRSASVRCTASLATTPTMSELVRNGLRNGNAAHREPWQGPEQAATEHTTRDLVTLLAARVDDLAAKIENEHAVLREQLRQHTWVMESWCETAEVPWSDVDPAARPLIAAVELAERTRGSAPAIDAEALVGSILTNAGTGLGVDPAAAVAGAGPYLDDRLSDAPHPMLFPLATALRRWRAGANELEHDGRVAGRRSHAGWQDEATLAMQAYREALALRALGHE